RPPLFPYTTLFRSGDLGVLEALFAAKLENLAALLRQRFDRRVHSLLQFRSNHLVFRRRRARGVDRRNCRLARDDALMTDVIERAVAGRTEQVSSKSLLDLQ